jgi:hypothetical protein
MSVAKQQKSAKPTPEEIINAELNGDMKQNALNFTAFMTENKMTLRYASLNSWKAMYKGRTICYFRVNYTPIVSDGWIVQFNHLTQKWFTDYDEHLTNAGLKDFVIANVFPRRCLGRNCNAKKKMTILGRTFNEVCKCSPLQLINAAAADLENIKKYIMAVRAYINGSGAVSEL